MRPGGALPYEDKRNQHCLSFFYIYPFFHLAVGPSDWTTITHQPICMKTMGAAKFSYVSMARMAKEEAMQLGTR
eukprot:2553388-Amphidinium_carterae.1